MEFKGTIKQPENIFTESLNSKADNLYFAINSDELDVVHLKKFKNGGEVLVYKKGKKRLIDRFYSLDDAFSCFANIVRKNGKDSILSSPFDNAILTVADGIRRLERLVTLDNENILLTNVIELCQEELEDFEKVDILLPYLLELEKITDLTIEEMNILNNILYKCRGNDTRDYTIFLGTILNTLSENDEDIKQNWEAYFPSSKEILQNSKIQK